MDWILKATGLPILSVLDCTMLNMILVFFLKKKYHGFYHVLNENLKGEMSTVCYSQIVVSLSTVPKTYALIMLSTYNRSDRNKPYFPGWLDFLLLSIIKLQDITVFHGRPDAVWTRRRTGVCISWTVSSTQNLWQREAMRLL